VIGAALLTLPLAALLVQVPWSDLPGHLGEPDVQSALWLSLVCPLAATALCLVVGVPLAWVLARSNLPGRHLLRAVVLVPLVVPPVVGGVALLSAFGRTSLLGAWLDRSTGIVLPFSTAGVVIAEAFVALPFLVLAVEGALRSADRRPEAVAATLGASRLDVAATVTLPRVLPALAAGALLAWARALGEFGATITFAGNLPGRTQTMPLAVWSALQSDRGAALSLSVVLLGVSVVVLVGMRDRWIPGRGSS
jgi:molybdate transport system permease protein